MLGPPFFSCTFTCFMLGKKNGERSPSCFDLLATMCNQYNFFLGRPLYQMFMQWLADTLGRFGIPAALFPSCVLGMLTAERTQESKAT